MHIEVYDNLLLYKYYMYVCTYKYFSPYMYPDAISLHLDITKQLRGIHCLRLSKAVLKVFRHSTSDSVTVCLETTQLELSGPLLVLALRNKWCPY